MVFAGFLENVGKLVQSLLWENVENYPKFFKTLYIFQCFRGFSKTLFLHPVWVHGRFLDKLVLSIPQQSRRHLLLLQKLVGERISLVLAFSHVRLLFPTIVILLSLLVQIGEGFCLFVCLLLFLCCFGCFGCFSELLSHWKKLLLRSITKSQPKQHGSFLVIDVVVFCFACLLLLLLLLFIVVLVSLYCCCCCGYIGLFIMFLACCGEYYCGCLCVGFLVSTINRFIEFVPVVVLVVVCFAVVIFGCCLVDWCCCCCCVPMSSLLQSIHCCCCHCLLLFLFIYLLMKNR